MRIAWIKKCKLIFHRTIPELPLHNFPLQLSDAVQHICSCMNARHHFSWLTISLCRGRTMNISSIFNVQATKTVFNDECRLYLTYRCIYRTVYTNVFYVPYGQSNPFFFSYGQSKLFFSCRTVNQISFSYCTVN